MDIISVVLFSNFRNYPKIIHCPASSFTSWKSVMYSKHNAFNYVLLPAWGATLKITLSRGLSQPFYYENWQNVARLIEMEYDVAAGANRGF